MSDQGIGTTTVTQIGLVVPDIEEAITKYCRVFGVPRPKASLTDGAELTKINFRGGSTPARAKLAFFNFGQVQIELIEPVGGPSTWKEGLDKNGYSFHHIAFQIKDTPKVLEHLAAEGIKEVQHGHYTGGMYTYVDSQEQLGLMLELLENF